MNKLRYNFFLATNKLLNADKIQTALTQEEKVVLHNLAKTKSGGVGVEVGSSVGASGCFIASGLKNGKLYCVDHWNIEYREVDGQIINLKYEDDGKIYRYEFNPETKQIDYQLYSNEGSTDGSPAYKKFLDNTRHFSKTIVPMRGTSVEVSKQVNEPIDFLFIDAWHEYDAVYEDYTAWKPKLKEGGIVLFHDYAWAEGVQRVVKEEVMPFAKKTGGLPNLFWAWL